MWDKLRKIHLKWFEHVQCPMQASNGHMVILGPHVLLNIRDLLSVANVQQEKLPSNIHTKRRQETTHFSLYFKPFENQQFLIPYMRN